MIIAALLKMPGNRGEIKEIKKKVLELFGDKIKYDFFDKTRANSNLSEWEKTFLKTFSRHKDIFLQNKAVFCVSSISNKKTSNDNDISLAVD
jgi:hypothetical protein